MIFILYTDFLKGSQTLVFFQNDTLNTVSFIISSDMTDHSSSAEQKANQMYSNWYESRYMGN